MKKLILIALLAGVLLPLSPVTSDAKVSREPGGLPAFLIGCCWGLREGTEWNEGADMHWREWVRIIPYVNIIFMIWDGAECAGGITAHDWAKQNGANWY